VVVLDKVVFQAGQFVPDPLVEALEKEAPVVAEHLGLKDQHAG
jgi:hypothetical protein